MTTRKCPEICHDTRNSAVALYGLGRAFARQCPPSPENGGMAAGLEDANRRMAAALAECPSEFLYFVAFRGVSLTSRLIKYYTRSEYSHIAYAHGPAETAMLIEVWHGEDGLRWRRSSYSAHTIGTAYEVWRLPVRRNTARACLAEYERLAAGRCKYDWLGITAFILKLDRDDKEGRFCSEGAVAPLVQAEGWRVNPAQVNPEDFVRLISAAGGEMIRAGAV